MSGDFLPKHCVIERPMKVLSFCKLRMRFFERGVCGKGKQGCGWHFMIARETVLAVGELQARLTRVDVPADSQRLPC